MTKKLPTGVVRAAMGAAALLASSGAMAQTTNDESSFTMADIMASELSSLCQIPIEPIREAMREQFDDAQVTDLDQGPRKVRLEMNLGSVTGRCSKQESVSMAFLKASEGGREVIYHTALSLGIPLADANSVTQSVPTIISATIDNYRFRPIINSEGPVWLPIAKNSYAPR